jgi:hypothetical protein
VIAVLESTDMIEMDPPPARIWQGTTADGSQVMAYVTLVAEPSSLADERLRRALEERIVASALITIPVRG